MISARGFSDPDNPVWAKCFSRYDGMTLAANHSSCNLFTTAFDSVLLLMIFEKLAHILGTTRDTGKLSANNVASYTDVCWFGRLWGLYRLSVSRSVRQPLKLRSAEAVDTKCHQKQTDSFLYCRANDFLANRHISSIHRDIMHSPDSVDKSSRKWTSAFVTCTWLTRN